MVTEDLDATYEWMRFILVFYKLLIIIAFGVRVRAFLLRLNRNPCAITIRILFLPRIGSGFCYFMLRTLLVLSQEFTLVCQNNTMLPSKIYELIYLKSPFNAQKTI